MCDVLGARAEPSLANPNGVLDKRNAVTSRTWLLFDVKTLDLVTKGKVYCSGVYAISVTGGPG